MTALNLKFCPIRGCTVNHNADKLMCRKHWMMVPEAMRTEVWRAYHQSCARPEDRRRLERLRVRQDEAITAVNEAIELAARRDARIEPSSAP